MNHSSTQPDFCQQPVFKKKTNHQSFHVVYRSIVSSLMLILLVIISNAQAPSSGLVGYFNLDGNVTNTGSASITATATNITYTTNNAGASNMAIKFAGSTASYVNITDNSNLDFTGDFSIAFGLNLTTLSANQRVPRSSRGAGANTVKGFIKWSSFLFI